MLHHKNKKEIHKLIVLNEKKHEKAMGKLHLKRQIEYLKDTFCIAYRNGYRVACVASVPVRSERNSGSAY